MKPRVDVYKVYKLGTFHYSFHWFVYHEDGSRGHVGGRYNTAFCAKRALAKSFKEGTGYDRRDCKPYS